MWLWRNPTPIIQKNHAIFSGLLRRRPAILEFLVTVFQSCKILLPWEVKSKERVSTNPYSIYKWIRKNVPLPLSKWSSIPRHIAWWVEHSWISRLHSPKPGTFIATSQLPEGRVIGANKTQSNRGSAARKIWKCLFCIFLWYPLHAVNQNWLERSKIKLF